MYEKAVQSFLISEKGADKFGTNTNTEAKTFKVGYKNYAIEKPNEIIQVRGEFCGTVYPEKCIIEIADKFEQNDKNQSFIHEMFHAICFRFDLAALNNDEHTIDLLALGLYEAILDNPHIFIMADI